ncbi:hypothetical protein ABFX02_10G033700 [Erythranthe guttata]
MAIYVYLESILFITIPIIIILCVWRKRNGKKISFLPTNWPLVGMLPSVLQNRHRIQDYLTEILSECGGTFQFKFPKIFNMDTLITSDPANINHIFSKKFANYPKGRQYREIFEVVGDSIFNVDDELWEFQRKTTHSFMTHPEFNSLLESVVWQKVENGLLPVLDYLLQGNIDFDLQDIFQRFTYDSICKLALDFDPGSLCVDLPFIPSMQALCVSIGVLFYRHTLPEFVWKLQKWLQIGRERKFLEAWKALDEFIYPLVNNNNITRDDHHLNLLTTFRKAYQENNISSLLLLGGGSGSGGGSLSRDAKFMRDTALGLMFAGRDTSASCLTWLFWLIATNPRTKTLILEEIETVLLHLRGIGEKNGRIKWSLFTIKESRKLIYLHGALCESLRLYPPGPLEHKSPMKSDNLPSGHYIKEDAKVILSFYSIGRMESVWGKDCLEFKPERWISTSTAGGKIIKGVPSYMFPAFNVGPRTCLGKEMAFFEMKMVAATIIYHYNIHLVEGHPVIPRHDCIILEMKHGLRVKLSKRNF